MPVLFTVSARKKPSDNRFSSSRRGSGIASRWTYLLGVLLPMVASASGGNTLSLQDAVTRSLASNPALSGYNYRLKTVDGYTQQAATATPPVIGLEVEDALGSGDYSEFDSAQATLSISWILEQALIDRRVAAAESTRSLVEINHEVRRYDVAAETARDFLAVLGLQERRVLATSAQQLARDALAEVTRRVNLGKTPMADQLKAEVNLERRAQEVINIEYELVSAKRMLAAQWGAASVEFGDVSGNLKAGASLPPFAELEQAIAGNPSLQYFLTQERVLESEIALAKAEYKNRLAFSAGLRRFEATDDYGVVAGVSLPLGGSNRNAGKISALRAEQDVYRSEAQATEIKLKARLFVLYQEIQRSLGNRDALERRIIPRLEKALTETQKAYGIGKYTYLEWASLQQELLDARQALIDAGLASQQNATEIERLTGQMVFPSNEENL